MRWELIVVLGNLAYASSAAAFLVRDMLWLRLLSVFGNIASLTAILIEGVRPSNGVFMGWLVLFLAINVVQSAILVRERLDTRMDEQDRDLHAAVFPRLSVGEFRLLLRHAHRRTIAEGEVIAWEGRRLGEVLLVEHGSLTLLRGGATVDQRRSGEMLGEVAFVAERYMSTTAVAAETAQIVAWTQEALRRLFARRPAIALGFQGAFIAQAVRLSEPASGAGYPPAGK